jgi:type IV pilus assembly protein PilF
MRALWLVALVAASFGLYSCAYTDTVRKEGTYHYQMGISHFNEGNMAAALTEFSEAEKYDSSNPELFNYQGMAYYNKKKFEIAEKKYLTALSLNPNYSMARNNLGADYLAMQRWDEAIKQFNIVTDDIFYQNQADAHINLGSAYMGKGDYPKALSIFRKVVADYPRDPRGRYFLGRVYSELEKNDLAIEEYKKAIDMNKEFPVAHYYLGLAYLKTKNNRAAETSFKEVIRTAPDSEIGQLSKEYIDTLK